MPFRKRSFMPHEMPFCHFVRYRSLCLITWYNRLPSKWIISFTSTGRRAWSALIVLPPLNSEFVRCLLWWKSLLANQDFSRANRNSSFGCFANVSGNYHRWIRMSKSKCFFFLVLRSNAGIRGRGRFHGGGNFRSCELVCFPSCILTFVDLLFIRVLSSALEC